jgi:hypothetical protein
LIRPALRASQGDQGAERTALVHGSPWPHQPRGCSSSVRPASSCSIPSKTCCGEPSATACASTRPLVTCACNIVSFCAVSKLGARLWWRACRYARGTCRFRGRSLRPAGRSSRCFADQRGGIELRRSDAHVGDAFRDRVRRLLNLGRLRSALALFIAGDYRDPPGGLGKPHRRVSPAGCQGAAGPENRTTREAGGSARAMAKAPHRWGSGSSTPVRLDHWRR